MMKYNLSYILIAVFLFYGCGPDDEVIETVAQPEALNKVDLLINGVPPENAIRNLSASVCCDRAIYVSFTHHVENGVSGSFGGSGLDLSLDRSGRLQGLSYRSYAPSAQYYSAYFTPASTITISDFELIENELLRFKISGQIFKETHNFFEQPEFVTIEAVIEIKKFVNCSGCNSVVDSFSNTNDFIFYNFSQSRQGNDIWYTARTNNGYQIEFDNLTQRLSDMPLGTYAFGENASMERINFRKFIGVPRAFTWMILPQEWIEYKTSGSFEIYEKVRLDNGQRVARVKFNVTAKENDVVVYEFRDAQLQTGF